MTPRKITHATRREIVEVEIDGVTEIYELREMNAYAYQEWQDLHRARVEYSEAEGKKVASGIKTSAGAYSELLSRCLWKDNQLVDSSVINAMPSNVADGLYAIAIEVNQIGGNQPPKG